ncbi:iron chaperone [Nonomuraea sp. AD125B]|uniref:iron chaperone n=1 Tax=Nonomuraea TaxID=83681 RepID=UPI0035287DEE
MSAAKNTKATTFEGFSEEERAAMKEHAQELKKTARRGSKQVDLEPDVLAKIAEMEGPDREMAERIHAIIKASAPELAPKLWYGMPAYAKNGKVLCFFQPATKFKTRYATLGFNDVANIDEGTMWPSAYALTDLGPDEEARIAALMKKAVSEGE